MLKVLAIIFTVLSYQSVFAATYYSDVPVSKLEEVINSELDHNHKYFGLASIYNDVRVYSLNDNAVNLIDNYENIKVTPGTSIVLSGQRKIILIDNINSQFSWNSILFKFGDESKDVTNLSKEYVNVTSFEKTFLQRAEDPSWLYNLESNIWIFQKLAKATEYTLRFINQMHELGYAVSILLIASLTKIITLPAGLIVMRLEKKAALIRKMLEPELRHIKDNYRGEKAHRLFLQAHKKCGVSPYYRLKPLIFVLIPIPIYVAAFDVLSILSDLSQNGFLWISNLAKPDLFYVFRFDAAMFNFNILPLLMTFISISSIVFLSDQGLDHSTLRRKKQKIIFLSVVFLIIFYPFPAALVIYWIGITTTGILLNLWVERWRN